MRRGLRTETERVVLLCLLRMDGAEDLLAKMEGLVDNGLTDLDLTLRDSTLTVLERLVDEAALVSGGFHDRSEIKNIVGGEGRRREVDLLFLGGSLSGLLLLLVLERGRDGRRFDGGSGRGGLSVDGEVGRTGAEVELASEELHTDAEGDLASSLDLGKLLVDESRRELVAETSGDLVDDLGADRGGGDLGPRAVGFRTDRKDGRFGDGGGVERGAEEAVEEVSDDERVVVRAGGAKLAVEEVLGSANDHLGL
jgi:hypothetical protein